MKRRVFSVGLSAVALMVLCITLARCGSGIADSATCEDTSSGDDLRGGLGEEPADCELNGGCKDGLTACDDVCVDTQTDTQNCGGCAVACQRGDICAFVAHLGGVACVEDDVPDPGTNPTPTPTPGAIATPTPTPGAIATPTPTATATPTPNAPNVPAACAVQPGGQVIRFTGGSLQAAVNAAPAGSVIIIGPNTFVETVAITRRVTLLSETRHKALVYGNINIDAPNVCVLGMRVEQLLFLGGPSRNAQILDNSVGGCIPNQGTDNNREGNTCDGGFGCTSVPRPCNNGS